MLLPLLHNPDFDTAWLHTQAGVLSRGHFLGVVAEYARCLPNRAYAINLCEDRRNFMAAFSAALIRGQTVLMPSNRSLGAIAEIAADYPDCYVLNDGQVSPDGVLRVNCTDLSWDAPQVAEVPEIAADHIAAIVFTSGSTGKAVPNAKTWYSLVKGAEVAQQRFGFNEQTGLVATVPPQHMYGLETSVLIPMITGAQVFGGRPFFSEDIRQALETMGQPSVLVTTPIHLRACVASGLSWPDLEAVISATAPLDTALAAKAEALFEAPVLEIYGCTEAGSLATRRTTQDTAWKLYEGIQLNHQGDQAVVSARHLEAEVPLNDVVDAVDESRFRLQGRHADMLNIAGKRASLLDLNLKLNAIAGVKDGVMVVPDKNGQAVTRLAALVVAPECSDNEILEVLSQQLDPIFLPRPIYRVDALPRNETGKLPRDALMKLLREREGRA